MIDDRQRASGSGQNVFARAWSRLVHIVKCTASRGRRYAPTSTSAAANEEGKDAAADDYQDLCRQRAKGATNNKGNVSPTVVNERADSPRSSTSSWFIIQYVFIIN